MLTVWKQCLKLVLQVSSSSVPAHCVCENSRIFNSLLTYLELENIEIEIKLPLFQTVEEVCRSVKREEQEAGETGCTASIIWLRAGRKRSTFLLIEAMHN